MATPGRKPGSPKVPGSGRKRGSLDKTERLLITEKLAFDIVKVYKRLGPDWLFKIAQERPDLFLNQCLSRLLPPAFKEDPDVQFNQQVNIGNMTDFDAAKRIAFALSKAMDQQGQPAIKAERVEPTAPLDYPAPAEPTDADRSRWVSELHLSDEQRADRAAIRETHEASLESYIGSSDEQGLRRRELL